MQRDADDIFRIRDLSLLKSPLPGHIRAASSNQSNNGAGSKTLPASLKSTPIALPVQPIFAPSVSLVKPSFTTPRPMGPPPARPRPSPLAAFSKSSTNLVSLLSPHPDPSTPLRAIHEEKSCTAMMLEERKEKEALESVVDNVEPHSVPLAQSHIEPQVDRKTSMTTEIFVDPTNEASAGEGLEEIVPRRKRGRPRRTPLLSTPPQTAKTEHLEVKEDGKENAVAILNESVDKGKEKAQKNSSNECVLDNWYFQKIPNNPKFSQVDRDLCEEWIVLVGLKTGASELWHSSIVTGRVDSKTILTGSGRVYRILNFNKDTFLQAGFSQKLASSFEEGFPENWRDLLIDGLRPKKQYARTPGPKMSTKAKEPSNRRKTLPLPETPIVLGSTRSGRKVVTPIPFWDSRAAASYRPSPSLNIKRRWGNKVVQADLETTSDAKHPKL